MVMCSNCHKRVAVIFVTKLEKGEKTSSGLCLKCAKELGVPIDNMLGDIYGKMGITPDQLNSMEDEVSGMLESLSSDEGEDGGAPAIDIPKLFRESGLFPKAAAPNAGGVVPHKKPEGDNAGQGKKGGDTPKKEYKYLTTYCRNLTKYAREGKLDRIVGREKETDRVIQILCRRQKNNPCLITHHRFQYFSVCKNNGH